MATLQNFNATPDVLDVTETRRFDTVENLDDGTEVTDQFAPTIKSVPSSLYNCMPQHSSRIEDFLSREVILKQGNWSNEEKGTLLWTGYFPKDLLAVSQNALKVRGFVGMRARVRVQVKVNSNQFQAGCLGLYYIPYADYMTSHAQWISSTTGAPSANNLPCLTSCPGVELDLANNTAESFTTPYVSPYLYANLVTGQGSFGAVYLTVLSPVASSAASNVSYTVFACFEDVTLVCPTDAPLATNWAQADTELRVRESTGTISGIVSTVGSSLSNFLPRVGLGSFAAPVAAATTVGTGLLRLFGFSKPTDQKPVTRVLQSPAHFFLNSDGVDTSHKLGLSGANELQLLDGFAGTSEDELNIDYMCRRPGYISSFDWTATQIPDTLLARFYVTPRRLGQLAEYAPNTKAYIDYPTLAGRVATFFNQWRGSIVYTFHFVKTQSHSGRVRISFRPASFGPPSDVTDMIGYAFSSVVDLSAGAVVSFKVPFTAARPWLYTAYDRLADLTTGDLWNCASGVLDVVVLNQLQAASTVSSTVDVVVFAHMEEAEFSSPVLSTSLPYGLPANTAQMNASTIPSLPKTSITGAGSKLDLLPGAACLGENIPSLRPLLKRYSKVASVNLSAKAPTTTVYGTDGKQLNIFPWASVSPIKKAATPGNYKAFDLFSHLYSMFAFVTGPVRYKIVVRRFAKGADLSAPVYVHINANVEKNSVQEPVPQNSDITNTIQGPASLNLNIQPTAVTENLSYQPTFGNYVMPIYLDKEGAIEFEVPYYSTGHMVCTKYGTYSLTDRRSSVVPVPIITVVFPDSFVPAGGSSTIDIFRAAGDSMSFGGLLGSPAIATYQYEIDPSAPPTNNAQQNDGPIVAANPATGFHVQTEDFEAVNYHSTMTSLATMQGVFPVGPLWMMIMITTDINDWILDAPIAFRVADDSVLSNSTVQYIVNATLTTSTGAQTPIAPQVGACFLLNIPANMLLQISYTGRPAATGAVIRVQIMYSDNFFIPTPLIPFGVSNGGPLPISAKVDASVPVTIVNPVGLTGSVVVELDPDVPPPPVQVQEPLWVTQFNDS